MEDISRTTVREVDTRREVEEATRQAVEVATRQVDTVTVDTDSADMVDKSKAMAKDTVSRNISMAVRTVVVDMTRAMLVDMVVDNNLEVNPVVTNTLPQVSCKVTKTLAMEDLAVDRMLLPCMDPMVASNRAPDTAKDTATLMPAQ